MKKILIIAFLFVSSHLQAQFTNELRRDSTDIYIHSFLDVCKYVKKYHPNIKTIFMREGNFYSNILPSSVDDLTVKMIDKHEITKKTKGDRFMYITEVFPIRTEGNIFKVGIIAFRVSRHKKIFHYVNYGGIEYFYKFDSDTGTFKYLNSKGGLKLTD